MAPGSAEPSPPQPAAGLAASTLPELLERQARLTPENTAISYDGRSVTYRELNARANRLAHLLIARGVGPEQLVALFLPRSADLVVSVLAVLKAGAGYVPIDPGYPEDRIAFMPEDARPACAIMAADQDGSAGRSLLEACAPVVLGDPDAARLLETQPDWDPQDSDRTQPLRPMNTAYVIYTSGSTGRHPEPRGGVATSPRAGHRSGRTMLTNPARIALCRVIPAVLTCGLKAFNKSATRSCRCHRAAGSGGLGWCAARRSRRAWPDAGRGSLR